MSEDRQPGKRPDTHHQGEGAGKLPSQGSSLVRVRSEGDEEHEGSDDEPHAAAVGLGSRWLDMEEEVEERRGGREEQGAGGQGEEGGGGGVTPDVLLDEGGEGEGELEVDERLQKKVEFPGTLNPQGNEKP